MIFSACPPIYHLPGTWDDPAKIARCNETLIPHAHLGQGAAFAVVLGLVVFTLICYGLYKTFGSGGKGLRDEIKEHARMHEMGIAHGHNDRGSYISTREIDNPRHKHNA